MGTGETSARLNVLLKAAGLAPLDEEIAGRFESYLSLFLRWNERLNLSAIRDEEGILSRHFIESIAVAHELPPEIATLLDFGSGAGLPGIPIALCRPEIAVTLGRIAGQEGGIFTGGRARAGDFRQGPCGARRGASRRLRLRRIAGGGQDAESSRGSRWARRAGGLAGAYGDWHGDRFIAKRGRSGDLVERAGDSALRKRPDSCPGPAGQFCSLMSTSVRMGARSSVVLTSSRMPVPSA